MRLEAAFIIEATGGSLVHGDTTTVFTGMTTDSRAVTPGDCFVALSGERYDGHRFIGNALAAGAAGAIVMQPVEHCPVPVILVEDTLQALGDIAGAWRRAHHPACVAVTGSAGKTTVKEITASILDLCGPCLKTEKNFNNLIGLPQTLFRLEAEHEFCVLEMGTNRPGEIDRLAHIARPDVAILTNITAAHLGGLGSIEGVVTEKQAIFVHTVPGGTVVLNPDLEHMDQVHIPAGLNVITFSAKGPADVRLKRILREDLSGTRMLLDLAGTEIETDLNLPGRHNVLNAMAAAAAAMALGIEPDIIAEGISTTRPPAMRSEIIVSDGITIINDSYNANPASMQAGLTMLKNAPCNQRIAVLGDMLELGEDSERWHRELGEQVGRTGVNLLIVTGTFAEVVARAARDAGMEPGTVRTAETVEEIKAILAGTSCKDACVLVKASRALQLDQVVTYLRQVA